MLPPPIRLLRCRGRPASPCMYLCNSTDKESKRRGTTDLNLTVCNALVGVSPSLARQPSRSHSLPAATANFRLSLSLSLSFGPSALYLTTNTSVSRPPPPSPLPPQPVVGERGTAARSNGLWLLFLISLPLSSLQSLLASFFVSGAGAAPAEGRKSQLSR